MNKYLLFVLFFVFMLNPFFSSATHVVGGELNYRWIGGNNYEIRLTVYRDCINGVPPFDNPASIGIFNSTNNLVNVTYNYTGFYPDPYYNLSPPYYNNATFNNQTYGFLIHPIDSATIPNTITSPCEIPPSNVCYRVCHYIDTITLPPIPGGYHLVYQRCCRNFSIVNIVNPLNTGSTYDAWIPASPNNFDSNPVFNSLPSTYICVNNPFVFDHSATDYEGDSLVYQLCAPLDGASFANSVPQPPNNPPYASVTWQAPYSQANVFGGVPLTINPTTGLLTATPNGTGQFVYAVCVLEYRNGVLIGQTRRDFQVNIVVCANITVASILTSTIPCGSYTALFANNSTGASTYHWDFGDLSTNTDTSNLFAPSYTYSDTGWYHVMLVAFSSVNPLCNDTSYGDVYVRPLVVITVSPNVPICIGQSTVLTAAGTSTSYTWSPATGLSSTTGSSVTASPTSTQTYTVTGTLNGCTATAQVTVTVNPLPNVTVTPNASICFGQSVTLTANGASTYSWSPSTGLSSTTGSTVTATPTSTTTYTVIGTSAAGCTRSAQVSITVNPVPVISITPPLSICVGQSATLTAGGASTYLWTPATGLNATTGTTVTANPTSTITYTVTGTDNNGCTASAQVTVTVNPLPVISVPPATICNGQSSPLAASGASTYLWTPATGLSATTGSTVTANPAFTTTYTVTGTDVNGCTASTQVTVTVNPLPVVTVSTPPAICVGQQSATLTAGGASTYVWTPATGLSATTGTTVTANPASTITYTVTGTDNNGCTASTQVTVTVNPLPVISVPPATMCNGQSSPLTASGASTYVWTPATGLSATTGSSVTANPATTTTYTVTGTDVNGCTASTQVTVTVNPIPAVTVSPDLTICIGQNTVLTAAGANTYSWTPATGLSSTTGSIVTATPSATTTYTVTGDALGCTASAQVTVTINNQPNVTVPPAMICIGQSATLTANGANTYTWSPANSLSSTTGSSVTANPPSTITYTVVGDLFGCTASTQVTVTVNPVPVISVTPPPAICLGQSAALTAGGASTYVWTPATGLNATTGTTVTANPTSTITYTVTGTDNNGCTASAQVTVTVNPLPVISVPPATICNGQSSPLAASGASTYLWTPATGLSATTGSTVTANPAFTTTYTVTGTDVNGCTASTQVTVTVNPLPVVTVSTPPAICVGQQSATLTAGGASTYVWTPATGLSATTGTTVTANPASTITYTVTGTDNNGCTASTQVTVTVNPLPVISVPPATMCNGQSSPLTASGASTYVWTPATGLSATTGSSVTANPATTTTYTVTGTDVNGCTASTQVTVTVNPIPAVTVSPDLTICIGQNTVLTAAGANTYSWTPATGLSSTTGSIVTATPSATTTYTVTGDALGCTASAQVTVTINNQPNVTVPPAMICIGQSATLTANGANTYTWSPANSLSSTTGSSVTANPPSTITYTVVGDLFGCTASTQVTVTVNPVPVISVTPPPAICLGQSAALTAGGASTYVWTPATGLNATTGTTVTANPTSTITYTVTGTDNNGCTASAQVTVTVNPLSVASFTTVIDTCSLNVSFVNTSVIASVYSWDFGDAISSVLTNPIHLYASTGNYNVTLIATTSAGCSDTAVVPVPLTFTLPIAGFTFNNPPCSHIINFTNQSVAANSYDWNFGDNNFSTSANPAHMYALSGTYTVTLIAHGVASCADTTTLNVTINTLPSASFIPIIDMCSLSSAFFNSSSNAVSYSWDFGDNVTSTILNPFHTYSQPGPFTVTLIATDINGCADTVSQNIVLPPLTQAAFTFNVDTCIRFATFINNSVNGTSYYWDFGDGNNSTQQNPTHSYASNNTYNVTLIVTGSTGCNDTIVLPVPVFFTPPVAAYTDVTPICTHVTNFTNQSSLATNYNWNFGDNTYSTQVNPTHDYQQPGNYNVTLIASTPGGCADTTASPVVIDPLPIAGYTSFIDTCSLIAAFTNISQNATSYLWNFGDNAVSNSTNPIHTYSAGGTYTVTLIVTDNNGCKDTIIQSVNPSTLSQASYSYSIDTCAQQVNFVNSSDAAFNYLWDFGDGQTSTSLSPMHHYSSDGNYSVLLIANPGTLCADTAEYLVDFSLNGVGNVWVPNAFTPNHDGKNDIFEVVGFHPCEDLTFYIFNRWGELIYRTTESHITWNGLYNNGERVQQGVYVYILEGKNTYQVGTITVMR